MVVDLGFLNGFFVCVLFIVLSLTGSRKPISFLLSFGFVSFWVCLYMNVFD